MVIKRHFYALDLGKAIDRVCESCQTCASLKKFPDQLIPQSSEDPREAIGLTFAAVVLKGNCQLIFVLRECVSSYSVACFITDEKRDTLRDAFLRVALQLRPLDGPPAIIRVDPAPGFKGLGEDDTLSKYKVFLEIGQNKNINKNPVAKKAIAKPGEHVSDLKLVIALSDLTHEFDLLDF